MFVYVSNTNLLRLRSLTKETDGSLIVGASVTVTITDAAGAQLAGMAWPQVMADGGGGNYELSLPAALTWIAEAEYTATIDATSPSGVGHWEHHFKARRRTTS
jgi:hypothetical protein